MTIETPQPCYRISHGATILYYVHIPPSPVPEFIDPVFAKTSPKRSLSMSDNVHFGLVFAKTGSIHSGTEEL